MGHETHWDRVRDHFPLAREVAYLNSAAQGALPDFVATTYERVVEDRLH